MSGFQFEFKRRGLGMCEIGCVCNFQFEFPDFLMSRCLCFSSVPSLSLWSLASLHPESSSFAELLRPYVSGPTMFSRWRTGPFSVRFLYHFGTCHATSRRSTANWRRCGLWFFGGTLAPTKIMRQKTNDKNAQF